MIDTERELYSAKETERRREDALKRMLATPHRPHKVARNKAKNPRSKRGDAKRESV
jgi:hypothetical protein